jgi:trehalose utilization protein
MTTVTVWNEYRHERERDEVAEIYPEGIHATIAEHLTDRGYDVRTATLDEPEHGLTEAVVDDTDVLVWWGHRAHDEVREDVVDRVVDAIHDGLGFVPLHAAKNSKVFRRLMGTPCSVKFREVGETERLWVVEPGHPIVDGVDEYVEIPQAEMYGEPSLIPEPETLVLVSWFEGGEVFRSGCCYRRGKGRIFAFRPGHEAFPIYEQPAVMTILANAIDWAAPSAGAPASTGRSDPLEEID